ncbi:MAG: response regulator [Marinilabiliales bacterium]|nr:MAG: response regulator [Marinilabiliales bacterium]
MTTTNYNPAKRYFWDDYIFLVVEDEIVNYKFIELTLKKSGSKVLHAKTGREAIDICNSERKIDIILMDIELPEINGYDAVIEIRKSRPDILIIAQTAYAMKSQKDKCFEVGCNDYIAKPYSSGDLMEIICKYIEN